MMPALIFVLVLIFRSLLSFCSFLARARLSERLARFPQLRFVGLETGLQIRFGPHWFVLLSFMRRLARLHSVGRKSKAESIISPPFFAPDGY